MPNTSPAIDTAGTVALIRERAAREGVAPQPDRRPRVLAGISGAVVCLALRDWRAGDDQSPEAMAAAFDSYADALVPALTGRWGAAG